MTLDLEALAVERAEAQLAAGAWRERTKEHVPVCLREDCNRRAFARGLCRSHYEVARRSGKNMPPRVRPGRKGTA